MIEPHVARLASLGLLCLLDGESMSGVAGVTGSNAKTGTGLFQVLDFLIGFEANLMATPAALHAFGHSHGLPVEGGHGFHRRPGGGVLARFELLYLRFMAFAAGVRSWNFYAGNVVGRFMPFAMAISAADHDLAVAALFPIHDDARIELLVTLDALVGGRSAGLGGGKTSWGAGKHPGGQAKC